MWRKKIGLEANGGFEKKRGLGSTMDLILCRNRTNYEEKRWGLEPTVDLKKNKTKKSFSGPSESLTRFTITMTMRMTSIIMKSLFMKIRIWFSLDSPVFWLVVINQRMVRPTDGQTDRGTDGRTEELHFLSCVPALLDATKNEI